MALAANPKRTDPDTIPPAVRRAAEEAERIQRAVYPETPPQPEPQPEPPQPQPEPQAAAPEPQQSEPQQPEPQQPEGGSEPSENDQSWKLKYDSQVGRTRKLQQDVAGLTTRIDELQQLLATVQAPAPQPTPGFQAEELLTPEEKEEWAAVLPVMDKRFREMYEPREHELTSKISHLEQQLSAQGQKAGLNARQTMLHTLNTHPVLGAGGQFPWGELNQNDDFVGWTQFLDPMSGRKRQELLQEAYNSNDTTRVVAIFESFLREAGHNTAAPPAAHSTNGAGTPPPASGLERFAAPGPARSAPTPSGSAADTETFTTGDITRFYADKRTGKWKGREAEADAYEAKIIKAGRENRVRPGPPSP